MIWCVGVMLFNDSLPVLIDALGAVRAQIAALQAQEDALRAHLLCLLPARTGPHKVQGAAFSLDIVTHNRTQVNVHSLPDTIAHDPAHQITTHTVYLKTRPLQPSGPGQKPAMPPFAPGGKGQYAVIETYR